MDSQLSHSKRALVYLAAVVEAYLEVSSSNSNQARSPLKIHSAAACLVPNLPLRPSQVVDYLVASDQTQLPSHSRLS